MLNNSPKKVIIENIPEGRVSSYSLHARRCLEHSRIRDDRLQKKGLSDFYIWYIQNFATGPSDVRFFEYMCKNNRSERYNSRVLVFHVDGDVGRYIKMEDNISRSIREIYKKWRKKA